MSLLFFFSMSCVLQITQINKTFKEVATFLFNFDKYIQENDIHIKEKFQSVAH